MLHCWWPNSTCFSCGLPKIWFRIPNVTRIWSQFCPPNTRFCLHTQHLSCPAYSQHSTSHHITFFAFERLVLFSVYLYQKDERTEPWGLQSDKLSVSLLITVINAVATGWTVRGRSFCIPRFRLSFPLCCSCQRNYNYQSKNITNVQLYQKTHIFQVVTPCNLVNISTVETA